MDTQTNSHGLPKNLNLILSPHHVSFFLLFLLHLTLRSTNKLITRELRERFYVCDREIRTLPRTGFMRAGHLCPDGS